MSFIKVREKKKGSGVWWLFYNRDNDRWSKKIGTDKRLAKQVARDLEYNMIAGEIGLPRKNVKPFSHYCNEWLVRVKKGKLKPSTKQDYESLTGRYLKGCPFWSKNIDKITRMHMKDFFDDLREELSQSTVNQVKQVCNHVFTRALDNEALSKNPCDKIKIAADEIPKEKVVYSAEEIRKLLDAFRDNRYYPMILFFVRTGCRRSEVAAIEWGDLDLTKGTAHIHRGLVRGKLSSPKGRRTRTIDLSDDLCIELRKLRKEQLADKRQTSKLVFQTTTGTALDMSNFKDRVYNEKVKEAGLKPSGLHALRHSCASQLIEKGTDPAYVAKQLGHRDTGVTLSIYTHDVGDEKKVNILDDSETTVSISEENGGT